MKELIKSFLPKNQFAKSVSVLAGGTAAGQAIVIFASPLLTRLYSPDDFGTLAVFVSLLGILGVVASLRYELAIPLPESDEEAAQIVVLSILVVTCISLLSVFIVFWRQSVAEAFNVPVLAYYLWLLPIGLFIVGTYQILSYWAIRTKHFAVIARTKLTQSLSMVMVQIIGFVLGPLALIAGRVIGLAAGTTNLGITIRSRWNSFEQVSVAGIRRTAHRYKRFPIYSTWGGAFNTAGWELPPLMFAALFSASTAGIFMLAHRTLAVPMTLVGKAIADVFLSQAAEARRNGQLVSLVANIHGSLANIAMPPIIILVLFGPELFEMVFGENWRQSGKFAQLLAPFMYINFITSPLSTLHSVMEKQAQGSMYHAILLVIRIIAILIGSYYGSALLAVALFSIGSAMCWVWFLYWINKMSGNAISMLWTITAKALIWGVLIGAPSIVAFVGGDGVIKWQIAVAATSVLITARYIYLIKHPW